MKAKTTWIWFALAAVLLAFIFVFQYLQRSQVPPSSNVLPGLKPVSVTSVRVIPSGEFEIDAENKNGAWFLTKPISYPAQKAAIQSLLDTLQKLKFATRIDASEMREHKSSEADFGFGNPEFSIVIESPDNHWEVHVGKKTPPGDQAFVSIVGVPGAFVTDAGWLNLIPHSAAVWRDTSLLTAGENSFDAIVVSNNVKGLIIELRQNATNHLWRMTRPLQARADNERITAALQQLKAATVTQFVTDDKNANLAAFGLQPSEIDLSLGHETNFLDGIRVGKSPTNDSASVFAKRKRYNAVVVTSKTPMAIWYGSVNSFRDPNLLEFVSPPAEIEVRGDSNFILRRQDTNDWQIVGEKFPADDGNIQTFIKILAGLRVGEFVKDAAVTAPDLQTYGLIKPTREIIIRPTAGDTNAVIADLSFGVTTNGVYVKRADEDSIYSIPLSDFKNLPESVFEFRDRRIWHFTENDVAQITLHQSGKTRVLIRNAANKWSLGNGSQGIINPPAIEETTHRLGDMTAAGWVGRNISSPEQYGLNTNNLQIVVELKSGEKLSVDFGAEISAAHTALAAVTLDGERWAFVFPPVLYQFVATYLTIPANAP